ncbi:helix-turn-helix domain-containing protein [Micromonospora costi]|uniref:XRE family transcriptional regulator n=1 Tax=Micromonospora costi TaxID=1530042 RepID=A0A3B0A628_9ACTN|nr:XRE family transcriptional regulator [Micromonospora costi]RKN55790.1 XRE family transcriptional regulator [Micromonospora costi]
MPAQGAAPLAVVAAALRREREHAGLSRAELAHRAGIAESTLAQLEAGSGDPGVEALGSLATTLGVPLSRLVEPPTPAVHVVRAGHGPRVRSEHADFTGTLLSAGSAGARRDIYLIRLEPGAVRTADAHTPGSVEHVVVAAGSLRAGPEWGPAELGPGDYAVFPGDAPHRYEALAPGTFAVLVLEHP